VLRSNALGHGPKWTQLELELVAWGPSTSISNSSHRRPFAEAFFIDFSLPIGFLGQRQPSAHTNTHTHTSIGCSQQLKGARTLDIAHRAHKITHPAIHAHWPTAADTCGMSLRIDGRDKPAEIHFHYA